MVVASHKDTKERDGKRTSDHDVVAIGGILKTLEDLKRDLCLCPAVGLEFFGQDADLSGDLLDVFGRHGLRDLNI